MTIAKRNTKKVVVETPKPKKPTIKGLQEQLDFVTEQLTLSNGIAVELQKVNFDLGVEIESLKLKLKSAIDANNNGIGLYCSKIDELEEFKTQSIWQFIKYKFND